ncbi:MAG: hypothetical protein M1832_003482 [Thelocarpon impressellum]|nr:MAG: hypothetical protein M1832_003482 [Thelocarpon impressellum]
MKLLAGLVALALLSSHSMRSSTHARSLVARADNPASDNGKKSMAGNLTAANYIRRGFHSSAFVDGWLYIDGGDFSYFSSNGDGQMIIEPQRTTLGIDLRKGFNNGNNPLKTVETTKPSGCPDLNLGTLWYNPKEKALMGGFAGESSTNATYPTSMWKFALDGKGGGTWSEVTASMGPGFKGLTRPSSGMTAASNDSAFYLGGFSDHLTTPETKGLGENQTVPLPGLVEYNFQDSSWTNHSATQYSPGGIAAFGEMVFMSNYGEKGLYVMFGGASDGLQNYTSNNTMQGFDVITIYDPAEKKWYHQKATGIVPPPRYQFCAVGQQASNGNAFDIFMYGGWTGALGEDNVKYDEVYVLTLPAFQWVRVAYGGTRPRYGHKCYIVAERQMLFVGGLDPSQVNTTAVFMTKDNVQQGLGVFDMGALSWMPGLSVDPTPYVQNGQLALIYSSEAKFPSTWTDAALAQVMGDTGRGGPSAATRPVPKNAGQLSTGLIVGAAVGGLCAVGLIIIGAWLLLRLKNQKPALGPPPPLPRMVAPMYGSDRASSFNSEKKLHDPYSPDGSVLREEFAPSEKTTAGGGVLGVYREGGHGAGRQYGRPQRVVELAHPQVAAVELDSSISNGGSSMRSAPSTRSAGSMLSAPSMRQGEKRI